MTQKNSLASTMQGNKNGYNDRVVKAHTELQNFFNKFDSTPVKTDGPVTRKTALENF